MRITKPFDFAQGRELAERQMDVFRQLHSTDDALMVDQRKI
jgi:hypothetical protein